jgi:hypothetical protein
VLLCQFAIGLEAPASVAIYSCNVASIGKSTHAGGTAGAHLSYIGREGAEPVIICEHMPSDPARARSWMDRQESEDRKNARLGDKIRLALPRELDAAQRADLVREFMGDLGQGRVPWFAGIHQTGDDRHNPHVHIFVRDRDIETGKRVLRLSDSSRDREKAGLEPKAVDWVRERWESICNAHLSRAGIEARIDRRSLEAQGIDREPTIHIGPRAQHIEKNVQRPSSQVRTNGRGREIDYPMIDAGRTRLERHAEIIDMNIERNARSADPSVRAWANWEKEQRGKDRALERELAVDDRRHTLERRRLIGSYRKRFKELRTQQTDELKAAVSMVRASHAPTLAQLRTRQQRERSELAKKESGIFRRVAVMLDFTGTMKNRRDEARKALSRIHARERQDFARGYKADRSIQGQAVKARYVPARADLLRDRDRALTTMRERHAAIEQQADKRRQAREADREKSRGFHEATVRAWHRQQGKASDRTPANDRGRGGPSLG